MAKELAPDSTKVLPIRFPRPLAAPVTTQTLPSYKGGRIEKKKGEEVRTERIREVSCELRKVSWELLAEDALYCEEDSSELMKMSSD